MDIWSDTNTIKTRLKLLLAGGYALIILTNVASMLGWIGSGTNADISKKHQVPLTPASWAFSIWPVIFILQLLGTVFAQLDVGNDPDGAKQRAINAIAPWWVSSWLGAILWTFAFSCDTPTSMWLAFLFISISLVAIVKGLVNLYRQQFIFGSLQKSLILYLSYTLPTSILASWLSVATTIQLTIALSSQIQSLQSLENISTVLALVIAGGGIAALYLHKDTAYGVTLLWAFVAVYEKTTSVYVKHASVFALIILLFGCFASVLHRDQSPPSSTTYSGTGVDDWESQQPLVTSRNSNHTTAALSQV